MKELFLTLAIPVLLVLFLLVLAAFFTINH